MIRLLIIAPDMMLGSLLAEAVKREEDFQVLDVVISGQAPICKASDVDVIALHAEAHSGDLLIEIRRLRAQYPDARIVLVHPPGIRDIQLNALEMGASGYVGQDQTVSEMIEVIRTVHTYGAAIDPSLAQELVERVTELSWQSAMTRSASLVAGEALSEREWEVLALASDGLSNAAIAERLFISVGTVKNHMHSILTKLAADNRQQASEWYRWQREYRAVNMDGDGVSSDVPAATRRASLLAVSQRPGLRALMEAQLERFCHQLGWPVGHILLRTEPDYELTPTGIWYLSDPVAFALFREATEALRIRPDDEVVGHVLVSPKPTWIADVCELPRYRRAEVARAAGIRSGLVLPFLDEGLIGAFEFYTTERVRPDPDLVAEIIGASREIGRRLEACRRK